jgi:hypothetical protein
MTNAYGYRSSPSNKYTLFRDGETILSGTEQDLWKYLHAHHCYSVDHAIKHEGYRIQSAEECFANAVSGKANADGTRAKGVSR